jgi:catechol 2,3-dioxygenase-like lactoylglutathione lyase family enzyme
MIEVSCVHHVGLTVADLGSSSDFYCSCGYSAGDRFSIVGPDAAIGNGLDTASLEVLFVTSSALTLELVEFSPVGPDLDRNEPSFGAVPAWCGSHQERDPDGRPVLSMSDSEVPVEVTTSNAALTIRLFELLGFRNETAGSVTGHGVSIGLTEVEKAHAAPTANMPGRIHVCCLVADMSSACAELAAEGFQTISTPRTQDSLQWVFIRHPDGPGVELLSIDQAGELTV